MSVSQTDVVIMVSAKNIHPNAEDLLNYCTNKTSEIQRSL